MSSQVPFEPLPGSNRQPTKTVRHGDTILRPAGPWIPAVHALLRHLERVGFPGSPGSWATATTTRAVRS